MTKVCLNGWMKSLSRDCPNEKEVEIPDILCLSVDEGRGFKAQESCIS